MSKTRYRNQGIKTRSSLNRDPPQLREEVKFQHRYRFLNLANVASTNITATDLLGAAGCIGSVTNTDVAALASSVRVKRVTLYGGSPAQGAASTCRIIWSGAANSPDVIKSDTVMNAARNPFVTDIPPPRSLAAFWQQAGTQVVFSVQQSAGGIIDIDLDLCLADTLTGTTIPVAVAVVGTVYYLALDGPAGHTLVPVGLPTTH